MYTGWLQIWLQIKKILVWFWSIHWGDILEEALQGDRHTVVLDYTQPEIKTMTPLGETIYNNAKSYLGKHITLNKNVPAEVGCAESLSYVLKNSGIGGIPGGGIEGTAALYDFLTQSVQFERIQSPEKGCIIVSPTGHGNGTVRGHTGILGGFGVQYPNDWGILSNDSQTGLFLELWRLSYWQKFYGDMGGLPIAFFKAV